MANTHPKVFISYSHDEKPVEHMDKVLSLANRLCTDGIDVVLDQYEESPPEGWQMWMDREIQAADFVLMICTETYYKRVMGEEVPGVGRGVKWEGRLVYQHFYNCDGLNRKFIPVMFSYCNSKHIPAPFQPDTYYMIDDEQRYERLYARLTGREYIEKPKIGEIRPLKGKPRKTDFLGPRVFISKLPGTGSELFGREEKLKLLDEAWGDENCHIVSFVAWGGVGKSALVNTWLNQMEANHWRGARRVYGWSFYSQGTKEDRQASADTFLAEALKWFGDAETAEGKKSPWDKGVRLAELVREEKTLLILDGLEPLQYPPGPMTGRLKDQGVQALLREFSRGMEGLCVITTREKIKDIKGQVGHSVKLVELENLTPEAGRQVLRSTGVKGTDKELEQASEDFGGHALALTLLGNFLAVVHNGEIRKRDLVPVLTEDEEQGGHAKRVMQSYEIWLKGTAELNILYLMGLFDRPAEMGAIEVLKAKPVISGLTENLAGLDEAKWKYAVRHLRDLGLLAKDDDDDILDCHPLVREHFGERLKKEKKEAWKEGHRRLYGYYKGVPKKELPDTLEEMEPLFRAVYHGCQAGDPTKVWEEVYWNRIKRRNEHYSTKKLGAFGLDLGTVACFFETLWNKPADELTDKRKAIVLNLAGFRLRAVGRLREAVEPMKAAIENAEKLKWWEEAVIDAENLSELNLMIGEVQRAIEFGQRCVEYADRSGGWNWRVAGRTVLGDALLQAGGIDKAMRLFEEAEGIQRKEQPYSYLYGLGGYQYCDLLLGLGREEEVKKRGEYVLDVAMKGSRNLLDIAVNQLSLGRAYLMQGQKEKEKNFREARKWLDAAVDGLRECGDQCYTPMGLFVRAEMFKEAGEFPRARRDLDEAREIAERGEMERWLVDAFLVEGRLHLAEGEKAKAGECGEKAKKLIAETGYHRRDKEAEELYNCKL